MDNLLILIVSFAAAYIAYYVIKRRQNKNRDE
jgi:hypothetical protein